MKKILCCICSILLSITLFSAPASAQNISDVETVSWTVYEYDVYVEEEKAATQCIENDFLSNEVEQELYKRAQLDIDTLKENYGYTEEQIAILKAYDGTALVNNPQLRAVMGSMSCSASKQYAGTDSLKIMFRWDWVSAPVGANPDITDCIAVRWAGTDTGGSPLNLALNSSNCMVNHYSRNGNSVKTYDTKVQVKDPYSAVYVPIQMSYNKDANGWIWAKNGYITLRVNATGSKAIKEGAFVFAYGHRTVTGSPSISLPAGFGISFNATTNKILEKAVRMSNSGKITNY